MDKDTLAAQLNIHPLTARLLVARGIDDVQSARAFLHPSLDALTPTADYRGLPEIAARLQRAVDEGEGIVIYGDYDCDGVCATSILYLYLRSIGADVTYFIPDRREDGYGITTGALDKIAENTDAHLLISVDCGVTAVDEVAYAQDELGFEVLITDHHQPGETLPDCIVLDPHLDENEGCFRDLCGAGVALRIVEQMGGLQASKRYYDIAALATVADVVPLVGDNRIIAHFGLILLNSHYRRGLTMLAESCVKGEVTSYDIAFRLAPRINAMGRVGNASEVVSLFVEDDKFLLKGLVDKINSANEVRQQLTDDLTDDCLQRLRNYDFDDCKIIVEYAPYWDEGVLGIAAARIVGKFSRPTILLTKSGDRLKGSGRSVPGVDILECVRACGGWLNGFGGHKMACGLSIDEDNLESFRIAINEYAAHHYGDELFVPDDGCDAVIDGNVSSAVAKELNTLAPFGEGNPAPVFAIDCKECGFSKIGDGSHLKAKLHGMDTLCFFAGDERDYLNGSAAKRLIVDISFRIFNNAERAEAIVRKVLPREMPDRAECVRYLLEQSALDDGAEDVELRPWDGAVDKRVGVVYIAFDPSAAREFAAEHDLPCYYGGTRDCMPECAVVVCPRKPLVYHRKAIFLDAPILSATAARLAPSAELYVADNDKFAASIAAAAPSKDGYAEAYRAIRSACAAGNFASVTELYAATGGADLSFDGFCACFYVFSALKFLRCNVRIECVRAQKTSLDASGLYRALAKAEHGNG